MTQPSSKTHPPRSAGFARWIRAALLLTAVTFGVYACATPIEGDAAPNESSAGDEPVAEAQEALEGDYCNFYPTTCDSGLKCCFTNFPSTGTCRNLQTDEQNCGQCGNRCGLGTVCSSGECTCFSSSMTYCPGSGCHNLNLDESNCGACGHECAAGALCVLGECCPYGNCL